MTSLAVVVLSLLAIYLPLEEFCLKWLPVSDRSYLVVRQIPDLVIIIIAGLVLTARLLESGRIRIIGNRCDCVLVLFMSVSVISVLLNQATILGTILNLKALLRYVLVLYILLNIRLKVRTIMMFLRVLAVGVAIQLCVGIAELIGGEPVAIFFLARDAEEVLGGMNMKLTSVREAMAGWIYGTAGNTIGFAMFLVVGLVKWLVDHEKTIVGYCVGTAVFVTLIYYSGSRAAVIIALLVIGMHQYMRGRIGIRVVLGGLVVWVGWVALGGLGVNWTPNYLLSVFTSDYIQVAYAQRLGIVFVTLPQFFMEGWSTIMLGVSADPEILTRTIENMRSVPVLLRQDPSAIEDVYWVALLFYYGVVGVFLFGTFLFKVWSLMVTVYRQASHSLERNLGLISMLLFTTVVPLNLFNQAFEVRQYSFFVWFLTGLSLACWRQRRYLRGSTAVGGMGKAKRTARKLV